MALPWPRGSHFAFVITWGEKRRLWRPSSLLNTPSAPALCSVFPCPSLRWHYEVMPQLTKNILTVTSSASRAFCVRSTNVLSVSYTVRMRFVRCIYIRYYSYGKVRWLVVLCPLLNRYICVTHAFYALLTRSTKTLTATVTSFTTG